jgi:hypothetical protein
MRPFGRAMANLLEARGQRKTSRRLDSGAFGASLTVAKN